jgi:hypothetical protein
MFLMIYDDFKPDYAINMTIYNDLTNAKLPGTGIRV